MNTEADDKNPLVKILTEAMGGVQGSRIAKALTSSNEDKERLGKLQTTYQEMQAAEEAYTNATTPEERAEAFSVAQARAESYRAEMTKIQTHLENQGLIYDAKVDRGDAGRVLGHLKFTQEQLTKGLAADQSTQEGKEEYTTARRAAHSHVRNVEDLMAKVMSDEVTVMRLGEGGLEQINTLRNTQKDLQMLAVEKFDGDLMQAMNSEEGKSLLEKQQKATSHLYGRLDDPERQYEYLGNAEERGQLQGIAGRLFKADKLVGGSLEDLLKLDDEQLEQRRKTDKFAEGLTDEEFKQVQTARGKRESVREKYIELASEYRLEGKDLLENSLKEFTGDEGLSEELLDSETGHKLTNYLQGTGMGNLHMRAYLQTAAEAAHEYHREDSDLTEEQRAAMKKRYGVLLDVMQDDSDEARETADPEEVMKFLDQKMTESETRYNEPPPKSEAAGPQHFEIGTLTVHGNGGATLEIPSDPQGT